MITNPNTASSYGSPSTSTTPSLGKDSIFDADCPNCGAALEPVATAGPADETLWRCRPCRFVAERAGGLLIEPRTRTTLEPA